MRILQLTPGTGTFYCGSCLRDNALVLALRELGHDATISPLYLPFHLEDHQEESDAAEVHMGGINVYLQEKLPLLARLPKFLRDALDRPGLLRWAAGLGNMTDAHKLGAMTVSMLRGADGRQRVEIERLMSWLQGEQKPDVILLSNVMLAGLAPSLRSALGVPILCSLQGESPFLDELSEPWRERAWSELRERTQQIDGFLPVSHWYGQHMADRLAIPQEKLHVVHNGIAIDTSSRDQAATTEGLTIGYLARMCRDKGVDTLVEAFIKLRARGRVAPRLELLGVVLREDRPLVAELEAKLHAAGLAAEVRMHPNATPEEKRAFLGRIDLFSVPATYGESFGLYLLEALAFGVPVVQPDCAAFPEILEATGGGILCRSGDAEDLSLKLEELLLDPARREELGRAGRAAVMASFRVSDMARGVERACRQVVAPAVASGVGGQA